MNLEHLYNLYSNDFKLHDKDLLKAIRHDDGITTGNPYIVSDNDGAFTIDNDYGDSVTYNNWSRYFIQTDTVTSPTVSTKSMKNTIKDQQ